MVRPMTLSATAHTTPRAEDALGATLHAAIADELRRVRNRVETLAEVMPEMTRPTNSQPSEGASAISR